MFRLRTANRKFDDDKAIETKIQTRDESDNFEKFEYQMIYFHHREILDKYIDQPQIRGANVTG